MERNAPFLMLLVRYAIANTPYWTLFFHYQLFIIYKVMTTNNLRQKILERLEPLPGEQVKNMLQKLLVNSSGNLEYFEKLLINESHQKTEELLDYGEIDSTLILYL
ncbi:hypothetical protein [Okeania sp. SIO2C9]|uniref:hypothetical protein n=1 Tax=Okeania sp. SIO2C9 TaxID=2607791 RepID=UPI0025FE5ABE|nr:hypothetical protein [Okeania sp. SIO2C9]